MIIKNISRNEFVEDMTDADGGQFESVEAASAFYDWLVELGQIEHDPVAFRCEFSCYADEDEALEDGNSRESIVARGVDGSVIVHHE